jgi:hypothetical protein
MLFGSHRVEVAGVHLVVFPIKAELFIVVYSLRIDYSNLSVDQHHTVVFVNTHPRMKLPEDIPPVKGEQENDDQRGKKEKQYPDSFHEFRLMNY